VRSLGFYTEGPPFEGDGLEKSSLGGSETAFIEITRSLAKLGHEVTAFNNCESSGRYEGVDYFPFKNSLPYLARKKFDVLVVSRFFGFFNLPVKASLKVLWNHDTLENPGSLRSIQDEIDLFLVLSVFHRDNYLTRIPQLDDRMIITRNGVNFDLLDKAAEGAVKDKDKMIYASRPERGLKILLEDIWPRLKENRPDLKLFLCGYDLDKAQIDPRLLPLYDYLDLLVRNSKDVYPLGALNKLDYYRHLAESSMLLYPSIFPEISCIVSLEAQALGVPILTSDAFALKESVKTPAFKVTGRPGSPQYIQNYVERALKLLSDPEGTESLAQKAKSLIRESYSWDRIASEWSRIFELSLRARESRGFLVESHEDDGHIQKLPV
jgi:glycosyltransferase involved in cell wall biosynthesis